MTTSNPIKYSDFIEADNSIKDAIEALSSLAQQFDELVKIIKSGAKSIKTELATTSGATEESREAIRKSIDAASRLERAQNELAFAYSETGAKVVELKMLTADKNKQSQIEATIAHSAATSYKELDAKLKVLVTQFRNMTKEQALNSKAGKELLDTIINTKAQLKQYDNALKAITNTTINATEKKKVEKVVVTELDKARKKLAAATSEENMQLLMLMNQTREANQIAKLNVIIANEADGSYNKLSAQYALNKIQLNKMTVAERESTEAGKKLVDETNKMYTEMSRLQEVTGKHSLSVGNYKKAWDGLGMSVNQIMREVPTAGISLNTFFLAISNNVPILVDEIEKVSAANKVAAAEGKATTNIWKSVAGAIFSWQSMLVIALTVLSMYGKQIIEWGVNLFKGGESIEYAAKAQRKFNEAMLEGAKNSTTDLTRLKLLYNATQNTSKSMRERQAAVDGLQKEFPAYFKSISDETILAGKAKDAYIRLAAAIIASAKARAAEDKIIENEKEVLVLSETQVKAKGKALLAETELSKAIKRREELQKAGDKGYQSLEDYAEALSTLVGEEQRWRHQLNLANKDLKEVNTQIGALERVNKRLADSISISDLLETPGKVEKEERDRLTQINKKNLDLINQQKELALALLDDELQQKKAKLKAEYEDETAQLKNKLAHDKELNTDGRVAINASLMLLQKKLTKDSEDLEYEFQSRTLDIQKEAIELSLDAIKMSGEEENALRLQLLENQRKQELLKNKQLIEAKRQDESLINAKYDNLILMQYYAFEEKKLAFAAENLQLRLEATIEGSLEENALRLQLLENQRKQELLKNKQLVEAERQDENLINAKWDAIIFRERTEFNNRLALLNFEANKDIAEAEFNSVRRTEFEKTKFKKQQEIDRQKMLIELAKTGAAQLSDVQLKAMESYLKLLEYEFKNLQDKNYDLYDMLGLKLSDEEKKGINTAVSTTVDNLKSIMAIQVELADKAVQTAQKRVDAANTALQAEIEARNNGYASSVAQAQRDLALEQKTLEKAQKEKEKAVKAQQSLDTILQTTSLITASAQIWKSLAGIPVIGVALALAGIATMWGSFIGAKIKANQLAKAQSYGEGGYEELRGGSHQSGNDIDLGTTDDGRPRRAEGGEVMAIINKRQSRKYKGILPDIINSLNRGLFEHKFMRAYELGSAAGFNIQMSANTDVKQLESDVRSIREQGEKNLILDNKGNIIEKYKNLTRLYKA